MEQRVSLITPGVTDLSRAAAFYDRLGWKRSMRDAEGVVFYQVGGLALGLWSRAEAAKDANVKDDGGAFHSMALAYNTRSRDEVDDVLREAEAAGGGITKPAHETFWGGYAGSFSDPDGFIWEVAHNEAFAMAEDGSITLPD